MSLGVENLNYQKVLQFFQANSENTGKKCSVIQASVTAVEKKSENFVSKLQADEGKSQHMEITIDGHNYVLRENTKGLKALRNQINDLENKLKLRNIRLGVDA